MEEIKLSYSEAEEIMEVDGKKRDPKTMRDENGCYPEWMNHRQQRKLKRTLKRDPKFKKSTKKKRKT